MSDRALKFSSKGHLYEEPLLMLWFTADWCGPCQQFIPTINAIAKHYEGQVKLLKINVDNFQGVAQEFGVRAVPTLALLNKDGVLNSQTGVRTARQLSEWINQYTSNDSL